MVIVDLEGAVIEESLEDKSVLKGLRITKTEVEKVTKRFGTPWLKQWTLHYVSVPEADAEMVAEKLSKALETKRTNWYADFKNDSIHYIIFSGRVFRIDRTDLKQYEEARDYGLKLGIPPHQVNFTANLVKKRA